MSIKNLRLTPSEIAALSNLFRQYFSDEDHLWIFGSRVDPNARGGDIDLYIETTITQTKLALEKKLAFVCALYECIGLQKIDVVLNLIGSGVFLPIYAIAKNEGIQLV